MPRSPYEGGKHRKHFTLSDTAYSHLCSIAEHACLSRSETLERLIRSVPAWEGSNAFANEAWEACIDYAVLSSHSDAS
jgi:hypothetical protein